MTNFAAQQHLAASATLHFSYFDDHISLRHPIRPDRSTPKATPPPRRGRGAARSRLGCVTCKGRHVRCDEAYPVCSHCSRLQLECRYLRRPRGNHNVGRAPAADLQPKPQRKLLPLPSSSAPPPMPMDNPSPMTTSNTHNEGPGPFTLTEDHMAQFMSLPWLDDSMAAFGHGGREVPDFGTTWNEEFGGFLEPATSASLDGESQERLSCCLVSSWNAAPETSRRQ